MPPTVRACGGAGLKGTWPCLNGHGLGGAIDRLVFGTRSTVSPDHPKSRGAFPPHTRPGLRYTKPTGLYPNCPWDEKAVRRLILEGKLAPRFPGLEEKHKVRGFLGCGCVWGGVALAAALFSDRIECPYVSFAALSSRALRVWVWGVCGCGSTVLERFSSCPAPSD